MVLGVPPGLYSPWSPPSLSFDGTHEPCLARLFASLEDQKNTSRYLMSIAERTRRQPLAYHVSEDPARRGNSATRSRARQRQLQAEAAARARRSIWRVSIEPQTTTQPLDNRATHKQAEPQAGEMALLRRGPAVERFEDAIALLFLHTHAGITDAD